MTSWWRDAVIYQVYPRSWADSDGDGMGDLAGITSRLPHLVELGVDALWCSPFYTSPQNDAGYDVADYRDIDPTFGTLADADELLARAHELGLRVLVDLVPNHTSSEHRWFRAALAAGPGSPERARYIFREGRGDQGEQPPNNWVSNFGGPGWSRVIEADGRPGQWYLHLFDVTQPDLDWTDPDVREEFDDILRFWLDRGVDGFRVDVAHGLVKDPALPDWGYSPETQRYEEANEEGERPPMWDQDGVHEIYQRWRKILDTYPGERVLVAEAWVEPPERLALYVRADEMHQAFNFDYLQTSWNAARLRTTISSTLAANEVVGATTTWVLSNHDVVRHASRFGLPAGITWRGGIGIGDPQPDAGLGLRRARAATMVMLALPGSAYLYQGEELGLPEHTLLPDDVRQDPTWVRSGHRHRGRDGCRVPVPWSGDVPSYGFGPGSQTWLPQPESFARLTVEHERGVAGSTYELYRSALRLRRDLALGAGDLTWLEGYAEDVLALRNGDLVVLATTGADGAPLPPGAEIVLASADLPDDGTLPADTAVWLRLP